MNKLLLTTIVSLATLVGCSYEREVKPIGWADFNNDSVPDAIELVVPTTFAQTAEQLQNYRMIGVTNGNDIYGYHGTAGINYSDAHMLSHKKPQVLANVQIPKPGDGVTVNVRYDPTKKQLDVYTGVDGESGYKHETFNNIEFINKME